MLNRLDPLLRPAARMLRRVAGVFVLCAWTGVVVSHAEPRVFKIAAGDAEQTLAAFSNASGEQIAYLVDQVRGQRTRAVRGRMEPFTALQLMLIGTGLTAHRDSSTRAYTVVRRTDPPNGERRSPDSARIVRKEEPLERPTRDAPDRVISLTEFIVSIPGVNRYRSVDAISAFRVRTHLADTPASISVMMRPAIDDLSPQRLFDVTRYVAGVQEGRGIVFSDRQIIRGFESNGRTVDNFFQDGADNFDEALVERIEVTKGPNAILAPAGVPGGSINVITKSPSFTPARILSAQAGLFDAQKATIDLTGPIGDGDHLAYRLVGAAQDSRRYWAADARLRGRVIAPMLTWRPGDAHDSMLTLKVLHAAHWIFREPGLILDPATDYESAEPQLAPGFVYRSRNGIQPWSHVGTETWDAFALFTTKLDEHLSLRVAANARHYFEDSMQEFFATPNFRNRYNPYTGQLTQDLTWQLDESTGRWESTNSPYFDPTAIPVRGDVQETTRITVNAQADLAATFRIGPASALTIVGAALTHYDNIGQTRSGTLPALDLSHPEALAWPVWDDDLYLDLRRKQNTWHTYFNQRIGLLDDRLLFTLGAMHYNVYTRAINLAMPDAEASVLRGSRLLFTNGIVAKPTSQLSLFYSHSTNSTPVIANNLPIWRDGRQHEFGLKRSFFDHHLGFSASWFRINQTNVVIPNPERLTNRDAPEQLISNLSDDGIELELSGGLTHRLAIVASYSRLNLRDSLGRPVRAVADENAGLLLNYRFLQGARTRLSGTVGATYAGARAGDTPAVDFTPLGTATAQSFLIPSRVLVNLGAALQHDRWFLRVNLDNVLDDHGRLMTAGGRVSGTGIATATGLNLRVTTGYEF